MDREDYLRLPEDGQRYEIVEGVLYLSPAPSCDHQYVLLELAVLLRQHVKSHGLGLVLTAPFEVIRAASGDLLTSASFPGLEIPVASLFP